MQFKLRICICEKKIFIQSTIILKNNVFLLHNCGLFLLGLPGTELAATYKQKSFRCWGDSKDD